MVFNCFASFCGAFPAWCVGKVSEIFGFMSQRFGQIWVAMQQPVLEPYLAGFPFRDAKITAAEGFYVASDIAGCGFGA
jgi:hypothetical protein